MRLKSLPAALNAFALGLAIAASFPAQSQAKPQLVIIILLKSAAGDVSTKVNANADGSFVVNGLEPGSYRVCLENGSGCTVATVGKSGIIRGTAAIDQGGGAAARKHNYVGHVTLLR